MRGEKTPKGRRATRKPGSPPLARGKVTFPPPQEGRDRITPACAGKSRTEAVPHGGWKDHPRLRGEKITILDGLPH